MKLYFGGKKRVSMVGALLAKTLCLTSIQMRQSPYFSYHITAKDTMQPYIIKYTKAGSLCYTNNWFVYAFLPVRGNHVVVLKEKGVSQR